VSDYRVRGIAQTSFKPALQVGADFAHKSGFYAGTFASNVRWVKDFNGATKGAVEVDLYGGYKGQISSDLSYDLGLITYQYPGNNSGDAGTPGAGAFSNASTTEAYGALTYKMFTLKYNRSLGNFLGNLDSHGSQYFDLSAGFDLTHGFTLTPHVGRQLIPNQALPASYTDYSLTLAKDMGNGLVLTAAAIGTNAKRSFYTDLNGRYLGRETLMVGAKYTF
jgi:uncharacterized protein (TIGR02001 family)